MKRFQHLLLCYIASILTIPVIIFVAAFVRTVIKNVRIRMLRKSDKQKFDEIVARYQDD